MKNIFSYWDISLGLIAIILGIHRRVKFEIYKKKRDDDILKRTNGKWELSYARFMSDKFEYLSSAILILSGVVFLYNRLNGNLPNIIILLKEFSRY